MSRNTPSPKLKRDVQEHLADRWPESADVNEIADDLEQNEEETRLALRGLFRDGIVSQDAEWEYRVTEPRDDNE
jgi:DNA-binding IclR family transcriptional regulator